MAANEFRRGMDHDIGAMLNRPQQIRRGKGAVHHKRNFMFMRNFGDCVNVHQVGVRIAKRFDIKQLRVRPDGVFKVCSIIGIHKRSRDAEIRQAVLHQVKSAAIKRLCRHNVVTLPGQRAQRIVNRSSAARYSQRRNPALQSGHTLFQYVLGRIGQTAINIARIRQRKARGRVRRIAKHIRSRLINRYRACASCWIRFLLTNVQLLCFKSPV